MPIVRCAEYQPALVSPIKPQQSYGLRTPIDATSSAQKGCYMRYSWDKLVGQMGPENMLANRLFV